MAKNRLPSGVYWALTTLLSDHTFEVPLHRLAIEPRLGARLLPATRVCIPARRRQPFGYVVRAAAKLAASELRPVVSISAADLHGSRSCTRVLGALADAGVREVSVAWPDPSHLVDVLDDLARVLSLGELQARGITRVAIAGRLNWGRVGYSADLLRAFDAALDAGNENDVDVSLLAPRVRAVQSLIGWERRLSSAGNRMPIRARIPGIAQNPARHTVPMLLGLAAAIDDDPECLIAGVQLRLRGSLARTSEFARDVCNGNFVVESNGAGHQFSLLPAYRPEERLSDD